MINIRQAFTMMISFQLAIGCNGSAVKGGGIIKPPTPSDSESIQIGGSIARVINSLSGLMMSSAHAAEGNIYIYDVSNPLVPVEMHSEAISGKNTFEIKLKKLDAGSKLIKAVFVSSEGNELSRELLFDLEGSESFYDASMDETTSIRSKIFEAQLIAEEVSDYKSRFREIKSDSLSLEFELLGDSTLFSRLMLDPSVSKSIAELVARRRIAVNKGDMTSGIELQGKIFSVAVENGVVTDQSVLSCGSNSGTFFFKDRKFRVFAKPIEAEVFRKYNGLIDLGVISTPDEAAEKMNKLVSILYEQSKSAERNMSARIYFEDLDLDQKLIKSCRLFGREVTESELAEINNQSEKDLFSSDFLNSLSYSEIADSHEAFQRLFDLYIQTMLHFKESTGPLELDPFIVSETTKRISTLLQQRYIEFHRYLFPTRSVFAYEIDPSFFQEVDFNSVATPDIAYRLLFQAHDKSLSSLREFLLVMEIAPDEIEIIMNEQSFLCKYLLELKILEMKWFFGHK